jgi:WD40 repeat protein
MEADGRRVCVSAGDDETLRIWDVGAGEAIGVPLRGHEGPVRAVAVTRVDDGPVVVSCGDDGTLRSWQVDLEEAEADARPPTLEGPLTTLGRSQAHEDDLDELAFIRFLSAQELFAARDFELNGVDALEVDGRMVAVTCGETSGVHAWDLDTGERVGDPYLDDPTAHMLECIAVAQPGEHRIVIAGGSDDAIRAWYLPDGARLGVLSADQSGVSSVAVRASGSDDQSLVFASGGHDGTVRFWDLVKGESGSRLQAHEGAVSWLSVDDEFTVSASIDDGELRVWRDGEAISEETDVAAVDVAATGERHLLVFAQRAGAILARDLASPSGSSHLCDASGVCALTIGMWRARPLLVAGGERELRIWSMSPDATELVTSEPRVLDLGARVSSLRIGPHGTLLAATAAGVACIRLNPKHWSV